MLLPRPKFLSVGLRIGKRLRAVIQRGVHQLRRHDLWRRVAGSASHGAHATWHGYPLQVVVSRAGGIAQGILIAQEVVDRGGVAFHHAHKLGRGLVPMHGLVHLPGIGARIVA